MQNYLDLSEERWDEVMDINLKSAMLASHLVAQPGEQLML